MVLQQQNAGFIIIIPDTINFLNMCNATLNDYIKTIIFTDYWFYIFCDFSVDKCMHLQILSQQKYIYF